MTRIPALIKRLIGDRRATAITEFALTAPLFLLLLMGIFDYSWQMYAKHVLQGAVSEAARNSTLEVYSNDQSALDAAVSRRVKNVFSSAELNFARLAYDSFDEVGQPEPFTDSNGNGDYDAGECYEDRNGNNNWDDDGGTVGNGGADDVVLYSASMKFNRILPVWGMLGQPQETTLKATTVLRNQPFDNGSNTSSVICT